MVFKLPAFKEFFVQNLAVPEPHLHPLHLLYQQVSSTSAGQWSPHSEPSRLKSNHSEDDGNFTTTQLGKTELHSEFPPVLPVKASS